MITRAPTAMEYRCAQAAKSVIEKYVSGGVPDPPERVYEMIRAIIRTLREPDEETYEAVRRLFLPWTSLSPIEVWNAMIDAASPVIEKPRYKIDTSSGVEEVDLSASPSSVDHPKYYGGADNVYEAIKVIDAWSLDFCLGNAVKYISRAGKKEPEKLIEDLEKARWYLDHEIKQLKARL